MIFKGAVAEKAEAGAPLQAVSMRYVSQIVTATKVYVNLSIPEIAREDSAGNQCRRSGSPEGRASDAEYRKASEASP